jgi:hypothetical protein
MNRNTAAILAITLLAYSSAQAGGHRGSGKGERSDFASLDSNDDGQLSYAEMNIGARGPSEEMFTKLDTDGDSQVSSEEFQNAQKHRGGGRAH